MQLPSELFEILENIRAVRERFNQDLNALEARIRRLLPPESSRRYARLAQTEWASDMKSFIHETMNGSQDKNAKTESKRDQSCA